MATMSEIYKRRQKSGGRFSGGGNPFLTKPNSSKSAQKQQYMEGGLLSDIFDFIQTPQYALTGLLSGQGLIKGVKERMTPAEQFNLYDKGWLGTAAGLGLDILTDPVTYTGIGALTKGGRIAQKTGKLASTFGKQGKAGHRAALTFAGRPLIKGEKALQGMTSAGQAIKSTGIGGKLTTGFRAGAPAGIKGTEATAEITGEGYKKVKQAEYKAEQIKRLYKADAVETSRDIHKQIKRLTKGGLLKSGNKSEFLKTILAKINNQAVDTTLSKAEIKLADDVIEKTKKIAKERESLGLPFSLFPDCYNINMSLL